MKIKSTLTLLMAGLLSFGTTATIASDDDRDEYRSSKRGYDVAAVDNKLYSDECGACHFAFQPGLLPERSWRKLMANLEDHFGENAELDEETTKELTEYLATNAGDHSDFKRSRKLMRSIRSGDTPLRITEIPYFAKEHREMPRRIRDKINLANCGDCHTRAEEGSYREREINIPGHGRWDD